MNDMPEEDPYITPEAEPYEHAPASTEMQGVGLGIASLVLGILGLLSSIVFFGIFLAVPGVICGHISRYQSKKTYAMGLVGLILSYLAILLTIGMIIVFVIFAKNVKTMSDEHMRELNKNMEKEMEQEIEKEMEQDSAPSKSLKDY